MYKWKNFKLFGRIGTVILSIGVSLILFASTFGIDISGIISNWIQKGVDKRKEKYESRLEEEEEEPKEEKQSENVVTFHKPKFLRKDETEILTNAQKGTLVHLCMQRLHENVEYDLPKVKELIQDLVTREIITDIEAKNINDKK